MRGVDAQCLLQSLPLLTGRLSGGQQVHADRLGLGQQGAGRERAEHAREGEGAEQRKAAHGVNS